MRLFLSHGTGGRIMKPDRDVDRVTLNNDTMVRYWTGRFDASPEELEEAIDIVGDSVDAVAAYLNVNRPQ
jgi:hypothetical protein